MKKKFNLLKDLSNLTTSVPVSEIMSESPVTIGQEKSVYAASKLIVDKAVSSLIIIDDENKPVGLLDTTDIIKHFCIKKKDSKKVKVNEIMIKKFIKIHPDMSIGEAAKLTKGKSNGKLPVVKNKKLVGYVTKTDLVERLNRIYYENTRLRWFPLVVVIMLIIIAILLVMFVNKSCNVLTLR